MSSVAERRRPARNVADAATAAAMLPIFIAAISESRYHQRDDLIAPKYEECKLRASHRNEESIEVAEDLKSAAELALENERLKSGLYSRVVSGNVEYTACRGCSYPEGGWPGSTRHANACWVEHLLAAAPNDRGGELLDVGHEMARRFAWLMARAHAEDGHAGPVDRCSRGNCGLHRDLLDSWQRLTGEEFRAGRAWTSRVRHTDGGWWS
jgi:hypothetical protein